MTVFRYLFPKILKVKIIESNTAESWCTKKGITLRINIVYHEVLEE